MTSPTAHAAKAKVLLETVDIMVAPGEGQIGKLSDRQLAEMQLLSTMAVAHAALGGIR